MSLLLKLYLGIWNLFGDFWDFFRVFYPHILHYTCQPFIKCQISPTDLKDLSYYEVIHLRHLDSKGRTRRDLDTRDLDTRSLDPRDLDSKHVEETSFSFSGHGRDFHVNMHLNDFLIPETFGTIFQHDNGTYGRGRGVTNCYYHGYLVNRY